VTEDEFRRGPAEDRLARVVDELRAVTAQVEATPLLAPPRASRCGWRRWRWWTRPSGWPARWSRPRTASPAPRTCELAALLLLLALGGCSAAMWSCPPGGGVLRGGGCRVLLIGA
jgi:hypothetical protein